MSKTIKPMNCPACGAPTRTDATKCDHCQARLATVGCPSCFGLVFQGARHCCHCGAPVDRTEAPAPEKLRCPRCQLKLSGAIVGRMTLSECTKCEGLWTDAATLHQICNRQEEQVAILGTAIQLPPAPARSFGKVTYVPCPVCAQLMNRVNFAKCSGVIVDVCPTHGTWFDKEELRRLVEFIRGGGLIQARTREVEELERRKRSAESATNARLMDHRTYGDGNSWAGAGGEVVEFSLTAAARALLSIFD